MGVFTILFSGGAKPYALALLLLYPPRYLVKCHSNVYGYRGTQRYLFYSSKGVKGVHYVTNAHLTSFYKEEAL